MRPMQPACVVDASGALGGAVEIRQYRHVIALAEDGSFARAAARVHLSQPAFSRSIQSVEDELGVMLFNRGARGVTLTAFGKLVVDKARRVLHETDGIKREIALLRDNVLGITAFGVGPYPAGTLLVPVLSALQTDHPTLQARVEVGHWQNLAELLQNDQLDFCVTDTRELRHSPEFSIVDLPQLPLRCFCRRQHPLAASKEISPSDTLEFPLASVHHPLEARAELSRQLGYLDSLDKLFTLECDHILVLEQVTLRTNAIMIAPHSLRIAADMEDLIELKMSEPLSATTHFGIVTLRDQMLSPASRVAVDLIHKISMNSSYVLDR